MAGLGSKSGKDSGIREFYRKVLADASRSGTYDLLKDPKYGAVIDEVEAGNDIKAVQVYCESQGAPISEGHAAVAEIQHLLGRS